MANRGSLSNRFVHRSLAGVKASAATAPIDESNAPQRLERRFADYDFPDVVPALCRHDIGMRALPTAPNGE
jgi:hypothetical protein